MFIQTTEALIVIDVNSGKFTNSATQDETILKTNIEAVHEIARQLRLRNIGGMIIIDFIDMTNRVDKLTMMEELELAMEADKAKPQVGQLSDLGLVEMTRHRQGQAISEIFAKRCPHCQGNGYIMEDIKFASSTSEGEYRAKAAKLKLPMGGKKNKFRGNENNNKPKNEIKELEVIQEEKLEVIENPSIEAQEEDKEVQAEKDTKKRNAKKPKFDKKGAKKAVSDEKLAQTVISEDAKLEPVIAPDAEIKPAKEEKAVEEVKAEVVEAEEKSKKPTRAKRPNRNTQKKPRTTKKTTKKTEKENE